MPSTEKEAPQQGQQTEEQKRSAGTRGKFSDIAISELSFDEAIALKALRKFDFEFVDYNVYDTLSNFGGGALVLVETFRQPETEVGRVAHDYQVLVKNGRGAVYNDYTQALRLGSERADFLSRLAAPDTVLALLTLILVAAFLAFSAGMFKEKPTPDVLGVALTTVIGFWFGRQSKTSSNTK